MDRFKFLAFTSRPPSTPALLSTATKLEIAATVLCGIAALTWVAAAISTVAFRHQVAMNQLAAPSRVTFVELPRVVVVGQRDFSGQADLGTIRMARADGPTP